MKLRNTILGILLLSASGCALFKKAQAPKADNSAKQMSQAIKTQDSAFYVNLSLSSDKTYSGHVSDYLDLNSRIRNLAVYDSARKHSDALLVIVHDIEGRFHTYQTEHANYVKLNASQVLAYKEGMDALFDILVRTENHYK